MIRLPASSISLSENDISLHLQQIDLYRGLLKQGFKPKDIIRYFDDHRKAVEARHEILEPDLGDPSATCVDLAIRSQQSEGQPVSIVSTTTEQTHAPHAITNDTVEQDSEDNAARELPELDLYPSLPDPEPRSSRNRHAPRKSSLLRFAKAVSPDLASTNSGNTQRAFNSSTSATRTYRHRSETYSYTQSEISDTSDAYNSQDVQIRPPPERESSSLNLPSLLSAEAEPFVPLDGNDLSFSMERLSMSDITLAPGVLVERPTAAQQASPRTPISPTQRQAEGVPYDVVNSTEFESSTAEDIPSSPPTMNGSFRERSSSDFFDTQTSRAQYPVTPTPIRRAVHAVTTGPRRQRHQDDNSFPVYNDSISPDSQPQTPADLSGGHVLTERDAAYTAPPGMIRFNTASASRRGTSSWQHTDLGEQSPTVRAIGIRERRAREMRRGIHIEGQRLGRIRDQDRRQIARGYDGLEERRDGSGPSGCTDAWRDEFDGDRIGDENFESEIETTGAQQSNQIRVVSGNAQQRLWVERGAM